MSHQFWWVVASICDEESAMPHLCCNRTKAKNRRELMLDAHNSGACAVVLSEQDMYRTIGGVQT